MTDEKNLSLLEELKRVWEEQTRKVQLKWQRSVSFGDLVSDRWKRAEMLGFGANTSIYDSALVLGNVTVGTDTWIGPQTVLDGSGGLTIGDNCSISAGVQIYTHDTVEWATSGGTSPVERAPVKIGNRCYIGPNAIITKGVTIGDGCVIGANSLVNKSLPDGVRAWGTPCRIQDPVQES